MTPQTTGCPIRDSFIVTGGFTQAAKKRGCPVHDDSFIVSMSGAHAKFKLSGDNTLAPKFRYEWGCYDQLST